MSLHASHKSSYGDGEGAEDERKKGIIHKTGHGADS